MNKTWYASTMLVYQYLSAMFFIKQLSSTKNGKTRSASTNCREGDLFESQPNTAS